MIKKYLLNPNWIGLALVVIGFGVSTVRVIAISMDSGEGVLGGDQVVLRIAHWQLEPGYREAIDLVIEEYEKLPHVQEAGVSVKQLAVTERVYAQFLNTHVISGTAPDISERGMALMTVGDNTAKYFEPLGDYVDAPNPYNAPEFLPEGIDPELAELLSNSPWRDTFIDGMQGGWSDQLQDYYSVPTAFWGPVRLYLNASLLKEAKDEIRVANAPDGREPWLADFLAQDFIPDSEALRNWVASDDPPQTLGQLLLLSEAIDQLAENTGRSKMVGISGSSYSLPFLIRLYQSVFTYQFALQTDTNLDSAISRGEQAVGWVTGAWSISDAPFIHSFEVVRKLADYFPPGFIGLDREQAIRRFLLGNALGVTSGGWDASTIFLGAENTVEPFEVIVVKMPLPGPGEKWYSPDLHPPTEAASSAGAPYQIYQRSENKEWALDFLKFMTSYSMNERMNQKSGWIPCIVGTQPNEEMLPFVPSVVGATPGYHIDLIGGGRTNAAITLGSRGKFDLMLTGDLTTDELVEEIETLLSDEANGMARVFSQAAQAERDRLRATERMLSVQDMLVLTGSGDLAQTRYDRLLLNSAQQFSATATQHEWKKAYHDQDFTGF